MEYCTYKNFGFTLKMMTSSPQKLTVNKSARTKTAATEFQYFKFHNELLNKATNEKKKIFVVGLLLSN